MGAQYGAMLSKLCGLSISVSTFFPCQPLPNYELSAGAGGDEPLTEASSSPLTPVLRISQLDAFELDGALEQLVWSQFTQCFQHFKPGLLTPFEPELKALVQLLLLHIRYSSGLAQARRYRPMSRSQKLWLAVLVVGEKWLRERARSLFLSPTAESRVRKAQHALAFLGGLAKLASLLNFLLFLQRGSFPSLTERLLGVRAVFSRPQGPRDLTFHDTSRELLWHGFAEFLIFLLPLVNAWKLKASASSLFSPLGGPRAGGDREASRCTECALCGEWPTMPHSVGCSHVFCYYCIKSQAIADIYLTCPKCGAEVRTVEPVKLQIEMTEIHQS